MLSCAQRRDVLPTNVVNRHIFGVKSKPNPRPVEEVFMNSAL
jgi:hypothetical protein